MKKGLFFILLLLVCVTVFGQSSTQSTKNDRPKVALVLGGGGAKGAATVGVLKYVEKSGVPIDMVVGTSIGSIVGGMYSVGYSSERLDSLFRTQQWINMFAGSLMGDSIVHVFRDNLGGEYSHVDFDELPIPFRCVAVDINKMQEVVLKEGDLAQAMRASMAIPIVFKPVKMDGMQLVDGGMLNNLPVDVARAMGADYVIAVDLTVNKHDDSAAEENDPFDALKSLNVVSLVTWALQSSDQKKYNRNRTDADIYINPKLKGYGAQDFSRTKIIKMIALGEKAGKASLKKMKKLKKKLK